MTLRKLSFRLIALTGLIGLVMIIFAWTSGGGVQAEAEERPLLQETQYPFPEATLTTDPNATPFPTDIPFEDYPFPEEPTDPPGQATPTPQPTPTHTHTLPAQPAQPTPTGFRHTPTRTATLAPGQDTPTPLPTQPDETATVQPGVTSTEPVSPTPAGTRAAFGSATPTQARTRTLYVFTTPAPPAQSGFQIDWGVFWIGFSIPVLAACGVVLYLLDRRPSVFSRSPGKSE